MEIEVSAGFQNVAIGTAALHNYGEAVVNQAKQAVGVLPQAVVEAPVLALTYKDPTYILPLALGVTMIITQRLQPQVMDQAQAKIMTWFMPIFFTVIMLNYPAGLALYIFTNNLFSIAQQFLLRRYLARKVST